VSFPKKERGQCSDAFFKKGLPVNKSSPASQNLSFPASSNNAVFSSQKIVHLGNYGKISQTI
jgi:hypothetical protein